ncbi:signal transduction histidine kinase/ligand-binding sensor domain-containing protein [Pelomonas saccharophila]|uniref:histidine kinase n=1 Tax=Roseateles saccharophilus TaxID=304 RepID=A0ABU1YR07_ROSSA|nr:histidine kinase [Roseateles saccharophilus]MDR7270650.1 signal transduction histidine kinase/ligand-binding sensor domain-containing protein [Roseateles saccharophilus]
MLESFEERDGLTGLTSHCLVQDPRAMLWICTESGLFRFDGFRMRREPLPPDAGAWVRGAAVDRRGELWVATERGLFVRHQASGSVAWTPVLQPDGKRLMLRQSHQIDWDEAGTAYVMGEEKRIWVIAPGAAAAPRLVAQPLPQPPPLPPSTGAPWVDPPLRWRGGALWFACGDGLCELRGSQLTTWGKAQGLPADGWATLFLARDGSLWTRSANRLARLAPGAAGFESVSAPPLLGWTHEAALLEDAGGAILVSTDRGVARWNGTAWREWTQDNGLPDTAIRTLFCDAEGSLWLGAGGRGVHRWVGYGRVEHWTRADGLPSNVVQQVFRDASGRVWAATREGVAWFDAASGRFVALPKPAPDGGPFRWDVVLADGDLWWRRGDRLFTVKAGSTVVRLVARDPALINSMTGEGVYYAFGADQVERLVPTPTGLRHERIGPPLPGGRPVAVANDGRSEWFVGQQQVFGMRDGAWAPLLDEQGEPVPAYVDLLSDGEGGLWVVDTNGARHYRVSDGRARRVQHFGPELFDHAAVLFVQSAPGQAVWVGSDRGMFILDGNGRWRHLHHGNGLIWNDVNAGFLLDAQGQAWIATSAGLTRVRPGGSPPSPPTLRVDELEFGSQRFTGAPHAALPWADRHLRLTLGTPSFSAARTLRIEYRLRPDLPWRAAEGSVLDIGALDAGAQVLQVRATGRTPAESGGPVLSLPFEIRPPWWSTTLARLAYAALLLLLWWSSWWWLQRRSRARRRMLEQAVAERTTELEASREALRRLGEHNARGLEDERKRVARELHDELGQQLAALRMEVSVVRSRSRTAGTVEREHLDPFIGRLDQLMATMRTLVSQLRPPALDGGLATALQWLASEFTQVSGVPCSVQVEADLGELPADFAIMVFRIAQESLNNVRRHAKAGQASLRLARDGDHGELTVSDDGIGFDTAHRREGYGVLGMEERARLLGGEVAVESAPGHGCVVRLRFRLP